MGDSHDFLFKILMVGDSGVGKSSLLLRFTDDSFTGNFISTIGVDFKVLNTEVDGKTIKMQIWDTAGQERFRTITSSYYRGAHGVILVYDVTDQASFNNSRQWLTEIDRYACGPVAKLLVGNKTDLPNRVVATETGKEFANQFNLRFFEASAKDGSNVEKCFQELVRDIYDAKVGNKPSKTDSTNTNTGKLLTFDQPAKKPGKKRCLLV